MEENKEYKTCMICETRDEKDYFDYFSAPCWDSIIVCKDCLREYFDEEGYIDTYGIDKLLKFLIINNYDLRNKVNELESKIKED